MKRRTFIAAAAASAALPLARPAIGGTTKTLIFVPQANLTSLDPVWTTATVTRNFSLMVYETLYGRDEAFNPRPQMVEGHTIDDDGKRWTMKLRDGLLFHDGTPVLARDCVASLQRWLKRDAVSETINPRVDAIETPDDRTLVWRLKKPFPLLAHFLSKVQPQPVIVPARLAATDPFKQLTDIVGCGPFRFLPDEFVSGSHAAFARFDKYTPRQEPASYTAGGHKVLLDRVEWRVIPDPATAANALDRRRGRLAGTAAARPDPDAEEAVRRDDGTDRHLRHGGDPAAEQPDHADQQCRRAPRHDGGSRSARGDDRGDGRGRIGLARADGLLPAGSARGQRCRHGLPPQALEHCRSEGDAGQGGLRRRAHRAAASDRPAHLQRLHHRGGRCVPQGRA